MGKSTSGAVADSIDSSGLNGRAECPAQMNVGCMNLIDDFLYARVGVSEPFLNDIWGVQQDK
jgi:hypothetical protein